MINAIESLCFDRIVVISGSDKGKTFTIDKFLDIPVHLRVKMIMSRLIEFKKGRTVVDKKKALSELRKVSANRKSTN